MAWMNNWPVKAASPKRARTVAAVDGEAAGAGGKRLLPSGQQRAVLVEQPQPKADLARHRSRPSNWPRPAAWTGRRRRGRRRSWWRSSGGPDSCRAVSKASGRRASSSDNTAAPGGSNGAMRATMRAASNAAISTVRAPLVRQFGQRTRGRPARVCADSARRHARTGVDRQAGYSASSAAATPSGSNSATGPCQPRHRGGRWLRRPAGGPAPCRGHCRPARASKVWISQHARARACR